MVRECRGGEEKKNRKEESCTVADVCGSRRGHGPPKNLIVFLNFRYFKFFYIIDIKKYIIIKSNILFLL